MHFQTNVIPTQDDADWLDEQILAFRKNNRKPFSRIQGVDLNKRSSRVSLASCAAAVLSFKKNSEGGHLSGHSDAHNC